MIEEEKTTSRKCMKCKQVKPITDFARTPSNFFPGHRALVCTSCYQTMIAQDSLGEVDRLCRHLDVPFDLNKWTQLYKIHKDHTLTAYFNMLLDDHYQALQWVDENQRWHLAQSQGIIDDEIAALSEGKLRRLKREWSPSYTKQQLLWLDQYYNQIIATQNVSTPILQNYARDLCEIQLRIKKGLREGADVKKDMDARDNIIKIAKFEASNAKSAADFQSVGELMVYYGKKGWHPNWHTQPQDSIDFMMQNIQNYLQRLVRNQGNFAEQVEDRKARYNMTQRLEEIENEALEDDISGEIQYEGGDQLEEELDE